MYIEGALQTRKWTGNDGVEKYTTEVVLQRFRGELTMLDTRGAGSGEYAAGEAGGEKEYQAPDAGGEPGGREAGPTGGDLDDEIPF